MVNKHSISILGLVGTMVFGATVESARAEDHKGPPSPPAAPSPATMAAPPVTKPELTTPPPAVPAQPAKDAQKDAEKAGAVGKDGAEKAGAVGKDSVQKAGQSLNDAKSGAANEAKQATSAAANDLSAGLMATINQTKYVDLSFGLLPNASQKVNNYALIQANYAPQWQSSFTYYSRSGGETINKSTTIPGQSGSLIGDMTSDTQATVATENVRMDLNIIQYKPPTWTVNSITMTPAVDVGVIQLRNRRDRFIVERQSFKDPKSGKDRTIVTTTNMNESSVGNLPNISFGLSGTSTDGVSVSANAGVVIHAWETYSWRERGSAYQPPLTIDNGSNQEIAAQNIDLNDNHQNNFVSNGFKLGVDVNYNGPQHGFGLSYSLLSKRGTRTSFALDIASADPVVDASTGKITNDGEKVVKLRTESANETRTESVIGLSWKMNFVKKYGFTPEFLFHMETDQTSTSVGGVTTTDSSKLYDFGLVFSY